MFAYLGSFCLKVFWRYNTQQHPTTRNKTQQHEIAHDTMLRGFLWHNRNTQGCRKQKIRALTILGPSECDDCNEVVSELINCSNSLIIWEIIEELPAGEFTVVCIKKLSVAADATCVRPSPVLPFLPSRGRWGGMGGAAACIVFVCLLNWETNLRFVLCEAANSGCGENSAVWNGRKTRSGGRSRYSFFCCRPSSKNPGLLLPPSPRS